MSVSPARVGRAHPHLRAETKKQREEETEKQRERQRNRKEDRDRETGREGSSPVDSCFCPHGPAYTDNGRRMVPASRRTSSGKTCGGHLDAPRRASDPVKGATARSVVQHVNGQLHPHPVEDLEGLTERSKRWWEGGARSVQ